MRKKSFKIELCYQVSWIKKRITDKWRKTLFSSNLIIQLNYHMEFDVGKEFEEDLTGIDDRKCMTTVNWECDKLVCVQKGEKEGRGWIQWVKGNELHVEMRSCGVVCKQVFKKQVGILD
ncbi:retinol-binding protein 1 isoform X2 [Triplophysa dalaica]|uniref:retinol-binding protein 1 isoform X2 n=1 Tax=Triplophysa dalaica TaxID=1582913 RepID=UPI0024DFDF19|nr:retinol-binding protein 1 isoform X2 [Triplophysa dalaica]